MGYSSEKNLTKFIDTLKTGEMTVVVGRSDVGASNLTMNVALQRSIMEGKSVAYFSLEKSELSIMQELLCTVAEVNCKKAIEGKLDKAEWQKIRKATDCFKSCHLLIDESFCLNLSNILAKCQEMKKTSGLDLVIVDYLSLLIPDDISARNVDEVLKILRALQNMAVELQVPFIVNVHCERIGLYSVKQYLPSEIDSVWILSHSSDDWSDNLLLLAERGIHAHTFLHLEQDYTTGKMWVTI